MRISLLGPLEVLDDDGRPVELTGRQQRLVLTLLLVSVGRRVTVESLVDAIWGEDPPASAAGTLQSYISRLRSRLGGVGLVWDETGYRLDLPVDDVAHLRFEALADEGRARLDAGDPAGAQRLLVEAEGLWRGPALGEFADLEAVGGVAVRLDQRRLAAAEDRFTAELALGRHAAVAGELEEAVRAHPLRERFRAQLALALYRSGRQADALRALSDAGRTLRDELGIEPSRELRDLEAAILAQDPALAVPPSATPVPAAAAAREADAGGATVVLAPLVGREAEWGELVAALGEAVHDGRIVVVEGEPGIGKTRLVEELRAHVVARGGLAVWGRSDEGGAAPALWPWLAPLRALAGALDDVPAPLAELVAGSTGADAGQGAQYERFEAVAGALAAAGATRPVAVLLDDLQWADATSLELLAFLAGRLAPGVLVVATVRLLEVGRSDAVTDALATVARRPGSRRLTLRGLGAGATAEVLGAVAGRTVQPAVAGAIHARAEGNPFYAIELARLLDEEGDLSGEVPSSVRDVIRRRLRRLPDDTLEVLGVAAVAGRDVALDLLTRAAGIDAERVLDALDPALAHRLLVDVEERPGVLRFSHALVREVVVEDMTALRRARLHLRVADALEALGAGVDEAEIVADHLWRAVPIGVGRRAAVALEEAADVAVGRVAYATAEELLTRAARLRRATGAGPEDEDAELDTLLRLMVVARALRYFGGVLDLELFQRVEELAERRGRQRVLVDAAWIRSAALQTTLQLEASHGALARLREVAAGDPDPHAAMAVHTAAGILAWLEGRIGEAVVDLDAGMAVAVEAPPSDPLAFELVGVLGSFWQMTHVLHGDWTLDEGLERFEALVAPVEDRFVVATILGFATTTAASVGDWERAGALAERAIARDPDAQFAFWTSQTIMQSGAALVARGEVEAGLERFRWGEEVYAGIGARTGLVLFRASLGHQLARHGRVDEAAAALAGSRREMEATGERWAEVPLLVGEAVLARGRGDGDGAEERFAEALAVAGRQGAHGLAALAEAARQT